MLWSLADARDDGLLAVEYPYFETAEATVWDEGDEGTTYVETDVRLHRTTSPTSGTTASARSSPRCSTPGWS